MDERKRERMVAYLRRRMKEFGIEPDDVASAIAEDQLRQKEARYRSATGETWDGNGEIPHWLKKVMSAGQSLEHFAVNGETNRAKSPLQEVGWQNDPFAGSPLATVKPARHDRR
ncbi:Histone family protein nucleoid-structuring protein H-NS [Paraburkholderia piptadeniae]|uniref:Histone family protein nucleoid-structuring protein H-NS n=1 Tax=Paraburkholderia piptadeniae TaxID=1701573 RepID=A0A1N7S960_9BURK|nr:H-NS family nucleoid-associated regulatory protein [Paraburkholderia piptadeniae]SIT43882.1 Histone family protein nucleoid-structuring protein H-NS [Paraburkholderia piptadeniae]